MGISLNINLPLGASNSRRDDRADSNTPLIDSIGTTNNLLHRGGTGTNPTVINTRLNELATSRATIIALLVVNTPQIVATIIILSYHWNDTDVCTQEVRNKWNWWSLISAFRMLVYTVVVVVMHFCRPWIETNGHMLQATNVRNIVDAAGLVWFLVGNVWLFGDSGVSCSNPNTSAVYNLCLTMLIVNYVQICLPCIIALCMIPVFCFCMPCLIRILARLQTQNAPKGATDTLINTLPLVPITERLLEEERTCPVCLNEMSIGDEARSLPCRHLFHKNCVDEWLRVNASCPTCRCSIISNATSEGGPDQESGADEESSTGQSSSTGQTFSALSFGTDWATLR